MSDTTSQKPPEGESPARDIEKFQGLLDVAFKTHIETLALARLSGIQIVPSHALKGSEMLIMVSPAAYVALLTLPTKEGG